MSVHTLRNAVCLAAFAAVSLLAACQGNIGSGSGLPAAPGQGVAPGQGGSGPASTSRQRVVDGAVYVTPGMDEIPLPTLGSFSITLVLGSPAPLASGASPAAVRSGASPAAVPSGASPAAVPSVASPAAVPSGGLVRNGDAARVADAGGGPGAPGLGPPPTALTGETAQSAGPTPPAAGASPVSSGSESGPAVPGSSASPAPASAPPGAAAATPSGAPAKSKHAVSGASPSPQPSGPKIDTKLTVYPEDAPAAPTPAPTGNVQTFLKRVALVRGFLVSHTELTLAGVGAVRFTVPSDELTPNRGFTVAIFDQSKKHHDHLVAYDANATASGSTISAPAGSANAIPLKKGVGYAFLLYGDELAPAAPAPGGSYPPPGNNPFVTPVPGGAAPNPNAPGNPANPYATPAPNNPYATPTPYNPYATPTPYNPYATPTPYVPYVPTIPPH
jgi:hypothetical protein